MSEARRLARDAGVAGVGRKGALVPNLQARAEAVGTDATRVAYPLFFGPWSEWGHTGAGSMALRVEGGTAVFEDGPPPDPVQALSVTGALYAYVLAELSRWIGLGIEDECDALRKELVRSDTSVARRDRRAARRYSVGSNSRSTIPLYERGPAVKLGTSHLISAQAGLTARRTD